MMKSDVLYIHPTKASTNTFYSIMPVGIVALVNLLIKNGYTVKGMNHGIEKSIKSQFDLGKELSDSTYKVLLLDLHWYEHAYGAIEIAELSKRIHPEIPVIIGGMSSTLFSEQILNSFPCIDYVIKGDGEQPLLLLADYLMKGKGSLEDIPNIAYRDIDRIIDRDITCQCENFEELDFITLDFLKNNAFYYYATTTGLSRVDHKQFWLCIARGCIFNCSYCCGSRCNSKALFGRNNMLLRSPGTIAEDIRVLHHKGIKIISPTHDFEMFGQEFWSKLFSIIRSFNIKPGLYLECFQLPGIEFLTDIKNTFDPEYTTIAISPLTGEEHIRKKAGKNFSNDAFLELLDYVMKNEITTHLYYSMNIAGENENTFPRTMEQMEFILQKYPIRLLKFCCQGVVLDPLAPIIQKEEGFVPELHTFLDYYHYCKNSLKFYVGYHDSFTDQLRFRQQQYHNLLQKYKLM